MRMTELDHDSLSRMIVFFEVTQETRMLEVENLCMAIALNTAIDLPQRFDLSAALFDLSQRVLGFRHETPKGLKWKPS
jgi:hypothetical protein